MVALYEYVFEFNLIYNSFNHINYTNKTTDNTHIVF